MASKLDPKVSRVTVYGRGLSPLPISVLAVMPVELFEQRTLDLPKPVDGIGMTKDGKAQRVKGGVYPARYIGSDFQNDV